MTTHHSQTTDAPAESAVRVGNGKDLTIAILSVTAVILLVAVLIVNGLSPREAMAFGQSDKVGKYVVSTAQLEGTAELLVVLNSEVGQINLYGFNVQQGQIQRLQQFDLTGLTRRLQRMREAAQRGTRRQQP